jgi:glycerol-3-phosphate cytidylyltransferase
MRVYTGGTFDLFHAGHVNFLRMCHLYGDVTVSLNTDEFIAEFKGAPPVMDYAERYMVLDACVYVDRVVENVGGPDSKVAIESVKPDVIIVGNDWLERDYCGQMGFTTEWLRQKRIAVCFVPYTEGISTTDIKARLRK